MNTWIDLRSDTVTQPTAAMRKAMAEAVVGDDVYREDPTILELENFSANLLGKESGLFVPSGTMGNLIAMLSVCPRGSEVIMGEQGHTFVYEVGGMAALGGLMPHTVANLSDGTMPIHEIEKAIRKSDIHFPITRMIILENTQNRCGGAVLSKEYSDQVADLAHAHQLHLHIDGARIFNAATALGIPPASLVEKADSITFCLSKGLCAPVGSVLCGSREFIETARKNRKILGGGMRQAGVLAAAGLVALKEVLPLLAEDHRRAKVLARSLKSVSGLTVENDPPQSNMIYIQLPSELPMSDRDFIKAAESKGVRFINMDTRRFRLVMHQQVQDHDIETIVNAFREILNS